MTSWHESGYNVVAKKPDSEQYVIVNLLHGTVLECSLLELYLLSIISELKDEHPVLKRFIKYGIVVNYDERAVLVSMQKKCFVSTENIILTLCPTMACNFDCPYCYEEHASEVMTHDVQEDVKALIEKMLSYYKPEKLYVSWYGGEPLLATDVIESLSEKIISLCDSHDVKYEAEITSNGYLLTKEVIALLERCRVKKLQTTLDGIGDIHDATRHLHGGGKTFETIISNLRDNKIPFKVLVRQNVHRDNYSQIEPLKAFVEKLARESGNDIQHYVGLVHDSTSAVERGSEVSVMENETERCRAYLNRNLKGLFGTGNSYCSAQYLTDIAVDDKGRLYKCWEVVGKTELSFGNVDTWDVSNPVFTADKPDNLTMYLNSSGPVPDGECQECKWLPVCRGGCPYQGIVGKRECIPFKNEPETFVLEYLKNISPLGTNKKKK